MLNIEIIVIECFKNTHLQLQKQKNNSKAGNDLTLQGESVLTHFSIFLCLLCHLSISLHQNYSTLFSQKQKKKEKPRERRGMNWSVAANTGKQMFKCCSCSLWFCFSLVDGLSVCLSVPQSQISYLKYFIRLFRKGDLQRPTRYYKEKSQLH